MNATEQFTWLQRLDPAKWERPEWLPVFELPLWVPVGDEMWMIFALWCVISQDIDSDLALMAVGFLIVLAVCLARYFGLSLN
ncbi:hypothetical protein [Gemmobacter sp. 24YEA27]|uniref:hypothetical protein n=1 Tax=Gemmobacter sp. 24YEA27 TaxID=3040672 RepID=UPI0024B35E99|nr:hypothetical protein [Gemmobacter sp. 24YEA27]